MENGLTNTILMIRPVHFRYNVQTAVNNLYQKADMNAVKAQEGAVAEFIEMVAKLRESGIEVIVILDNEDFDTPDSIFPNNWISFHLEGLVGIYPMFAENRRLERRDDLFDFLVLQGFLIKEKIDFTPWEKKGKFLEGTGSLVLDRQNKIAYAALSDRTHPEVLDEFELKFGYTSVRFKAYHDTQKGRVPIYHTNVLMSMGDSYALICLDAIDDEAEKNEIILSLTSTGKDIIEISAEQVTSFAGNALQLVSGAGEKLLVMSDQAFSSLTDDQRDELSKRNDKLITSSLKTIEAIGGGSARCMMAEVFLKRK